MTRRATHDGSRQPHPYHLLDSIARNALKDDHVSDADLIEFGADVLDNEKKEHFLAHVKQCSDCRREVEKIREAALVWDQTRPALGSVHVSKTADEVDAVSEPWWKRIPRWTPLASLRPLQGVYAAGFDSSHIEFPVYYGETITLALAGSIMRQNNEYYVRISITGHAPASMNSRKAEIVLEHASTREVTVQRTIPMEQLIFLGTDLPIETQRITARLIS